MRIITRSGRGGLRPFGALVVALACAVAGLAALSGPRPAAAEPASLSLTYTCQYPLIGEKKIRAHITSDIPSAIPVNTPIPTIVIDAVTEVGADTTEGLLSVEAATMEGTADAKSVLDVPGFKLNVTVPMTLEKTAIPAAGGFRVNAAGKAPALQFPQAGDGTIHVGDIMLHPRLKKADGTPTTLGEVFDAPCAQDPGQDNVLAKFKIVPDRDTEPPSRPGDPAATPRPTSVDLSWEASTDNVSLAGYEVFQGGTVVATTTSTTTRATVTGLTPETEYTFTVQAKDTSGNRSEMSAPVTVRTTSDVPDTEPPTAPGKPVAAELTKDTVIMNWPPSTDDVGVAGYDIYAGGELAESTTEPGGSVGGLTPDRTYTFTVRARDAAGNVSPPSPPLTVKMPSGPPKECGGYKPQPEADYPIQACVYMAGYGNVDKQDGAAVINHPERSPVLTNVAYKATTTDVNAKFRFIRPLRSRATFLTFGFMPTTATMELTQIGEGVLKGRDDGDGLRLKATATMELRVYGATAKGAPLELGTRCRGTRRIEITLTGGAPEYTDITAGGPLRGSYEIPPFTGCGVGEDLDPLLTSSISGAGNHIKITQGPICRVSAATCPPTAPRR